MFKRFVLHYSSEAPESWMARTQRALNEAEAAPVASGDPRPFDRRSAFFEKTDLRMQAQVGKDPQTLHPRLRG